MANLDADTKEKRDQKVQEMNDFITAREAIKERLTATYDADMERIDAEIAEKTLIRDGLKAMK